MASRCLQGQLCRPLRWHFERFGLELRREVRPGEVVPGLVGRKAVMVNASPRASVLLE